MPSGVHSLHVFFPLTDGKGQADIGRLNLCMLRLWKDHVPGFGKAMSDAGCTCNEAAQFNRPSNRPVRDSTKHENKGKMGAGKTICSSVNQSPQCKYNGQTVCIIMHIIKHFWLYTVIICSHTCCILSVSIKESKQAQGSSFVDPSPSGQALVIDLQVQKV